MFNRRTIAGLTILVVMLVVYLVFYSGGVISGSGNLKTEERTVQNYDRVQVNGRADVFITQGDTETLTIEADDNLYPYIVAEVRDGTLVVGTKDNVVITSGTLRFRIGLKSLTDVSVNGAGSVQGTAIDTDHLNVGLSGSGSFSLSGTARVQTINLNGSGSFDAQALTGSEATLTMSGSSTASVNVTDRLDVTINGSGTVRYRGNPAVTQQINGSGTVQKIEG